MGITRILCYSKTPAYLIAGRLCHSAALAKSQPATAHSSYLEARGLEEEETLAIWQYWLNLASKALSPARTHPSVNLTPARCRPKRTLRHPSSLPSAPSSSSQVSGPQ